MWSDSDSNKKHYRRIVHLPLPVYFSLSLVNSESSDFTDCAAFDIVATTPKVWACMYRLSL